jgi:hypothetical protein
MGCSVTVMVAPELASPCTLRVADHSIADRIGPEQLARLSAPLTSMLTSELDGAAHYLGLAADEILLAALGRTIARTIGDGVVAVDVTGHGALQPVSLACATVQQASATEMLGAVHRTLASAVTAEPAAHDPSEVFFNYLGTVPEPPSRDALVQLGPGHALELRLYRTAGLEHLDWWYDTDRFDHYTVEELAEQYPLALIELTSEAIPPI